jgi:hypothetical protein
MHASPVDISGAYQIQSLPELMLIEKSSGENDNLTGHKYWPLDNKI